MDQLARFFQLFDRIHDQSTWKAAFGEPRTQGDRTIIPVAVVSYGIELGGTSEPSCGVAEDETSDAGHAASAASPVAVIEVTPAKTTVRPVLNWSRLIPTILFGLIGMALVAVGLARRATGSAQCCGESDE